MRKSSLVLVLMFCAALPLLNLGAVQTSEDPNSSWAKTFGENNRDVALSVIQTSDGGYVITGYTESYGAGDSDVWLVKTDNSGNMQWSKTFGGTDLDGALSVIQTSDGGYALAGYTWSYGAGWFDFWLVKTDSLGNEEWNSTFGDNGYDMARSVIQTSDGGYALAGYTNSYGAGGFDFWLVKTDSLGNEEWNSTFGDGNEDSACSVIQTSDGGYVITGDTKSYDAVWQNFWLVKTDNSGNMQWSKTLSDTYLESRAFSAIQTADGGYAMTGYTRRLDESSNSILIKIDSLGNEQWSKIFGGSGSDIARSVIQTSDGGYAFVGDTSSYGAGWDDFWLVKTDSSGNEEWSRTFGGENHDYAYSVIQTSDGGYALAGPTSSYGAGESDFWLVKTDSSGNVEGLSSTGIQTIYVVVGIVTIFVVVGVVIALKKR